MANRTKESSRHIDVVLRALDILDCFQDNSTLSLKEIIDRTGITRSRTMRLLGTLESRGYLFEDASARKFSPGIRLAILGKSYAKNDNVEIITRPVVKHVAQETGESATFFVAHGSERIALIREEGTHAVRFSIKEGQRLPIYAGASGKVLLAFGPEDLLTQLKSRGKLPRITSQTITSPVKLIQQIKTIQKKGYAISKGENIPEVHAIAAPVFDFSNQLIGAVGIAGPASRLNDQQIRKRLKIIIEAANELCIKFGKNKI
jgi:DNA-binding IclR family transcriptional regulator